MSRFLGKKLHVQNFRYKDRQTDMVKSTQRAMLILHEKIYYIRKAMSWEFQK